MNDKTELVLKCSWCERPIAKLLVIPADKKWRVRATCPFCSTHEKTETSYVTEIDGVFRVAGYFSENPTNPLDATLETSWVGSREDANDDGPIQTFIMASSK